MRRFRNSAARFCAILARRIVRCRSSSTRALGGQRYAQSGNHIVWQPFIVQRLCIQRTGVSQLSAWAVGVVVAAVAVDGPAFNRTFSKDSTSQAHTGNLAVLTAPCLTLLSMAVCLKLPSPSSSLFSTPQHTCVPGPPPVPAAAVRKPGSGPRSPPAPPAPSCGPLLRSLPVQLLPQLAAWPPPLLSPGQFPVVMH